MNQARRREFGVSEDREQTGTRSTLCVAKGSEAPIASPALELQRALDEMLNTANTPTIDYQRGVLMTVGLLAMVATCSAFWWAAAKWAVALI